MTVRVIIETKPQSFPAGTIAGLFLFTLAGPAGYSNQQTNSAVQCDFTDATAPGDYTATVTRLDASGNALGTSAVGVVTIPAPATETSVMVDVPVTVTVSLV